MITKLTKEQITAIPELLKTKTRKEVAEMYGVSRQSITRWVAELRKRGFVIENQKTRISLLDKNENEDETRA